MGAGDVFLRIQNLFLIGRSPDSTIDYRWKCSSFYTLFLHNLPLQYNVYSYRVSNISPSAAQVFRSKAKVTSSISHFLFGFIFFQRSYYKPCVVFLQWQFVHNHCVLMNVIEIQKHILGTDSTLVMIDRLYNIVSKVSINGSVLLDGHLMDWLCVMSH